jgi:two-component system, OmpR family, response regulator
LATRFTLGGTVNRSWHLAEASKPQLPSLSRQDSIGPLPESLLRALGDCSQVIGTTYAPFTKPCWFLVGNRESADCASQSLRCRSFLDIPPDVAPIRDAHSATDTLSDMNGTQHILVVDDEPDLRKLVSGFLTRNGYHVLEARDGVAMMETVKSSRIDLVILDITMPGEDGLSLCRRLRVAGTIPIIMLTAMGTEIDRIVGLEMGADDYLPKPFNTAELLARIRAVLRRFQSPVRASAPGADRVFAFAGWRLDVVRRRLHAPTGALIDLRAAEFALLVAFVEQPLHVFTRSQLLDLAQGEGTTAGRNIDVHVSRLRRRIEADPEQPDFIKTVRGEGYLFAAPVTLNGRPW